MRKRRQDRSLAEGVLASACTRSCGSLASTGALGTASSAAADHFLLLNFRRRFRSPRVVTLPRRLSARRRLAFAGCAAAPSRLLDGSYRAHHASHLLLLTARATTTHISLGTVCRCLDLVRRIRGASGRGKVRPLTFLSVPLAARSHREPVPSLTSLRSRRWIRPAVVARSSAPSLSLVPLTFASSRLAERSTNTLTMHYTTLASLVTFLSATATLAAPSRLDALKKEHSHAEYEASKAAALLARAKTYGNSAEAKHKREVFAEREKRWVKEEKRLEKEIQKRASTISRVVAGHRTTTTAAATKTVSRVLWNDRTVRGTCRFVCSSRPDLTAFLLSLPPRPPSRPPVPLLRLRRPPHRRRASATTRLRTPRTSRSRGRTTGAKRPTARSTRASSTSRCSGDRAERRRGAPMRRRRSRAVRRTFSGSFAFLSLFLYP